MLGKHVDAIALLIIALTLLVFSRPLAPPPVFGQMKAADFGVHDAVGRFQVCPFTGVPLPRFR